VWLEARQAELLPVPYFHVVFTLPPAVAEIAFQNKQTVYGLLMRAAAEALMTLAAGRLDRPDRGAAHVGTDADPSRPRRRRRPRRPALDPLQAELPLVRPRAVEDLPPVVPRRPGGGIRARRTGFFGDLAPLADPDAFAGRVRALRNSPFVVYAKPPFGGPERVLAYLARYTHRTAIANSRLIAVDDNEVAFSYKDYRRAGRERVMRLAPHEFIRRFLLHVLPDGFHRIRHYGFLASRDRAQNLERVRALASAASAAVSANGPVRIADPQPQSQPDEGALAPCPDCGGRMRRLGLVPPSAAFFRCDTS
jgi:hypothetical protein